AAALAAIEKTCAALPDPREAEEGIADQRKEVERARNTAMAESARAVELRRVAAGRKRRMAEIMRETASWRDRQENAGNRLADLKARIAETGKRQAEMADQPQALAGRRERLVADLTAAETRRRAAAEALKAAEAALTAAESSERAAEKTAGGRREDRARLDAVLDAAAARVEVAAGEIRDALEIDPAALRARLGDDLPALAEVEAEIATLRRQRDGLGAVNLRADLDAEEVQAEHDDLAAEKADLDAAVEKLRRGIAELNREGRARIMAAFDNVNARFSGLFRHLFGGGEARLVMVESDDPLDAGLEILCQPPGKKLSTLSLLSGGEQTLTALSLIFAVFLSNPAPICVLDEVDAPLDDSNVGRFCDLLDEMRRRTETRFLIITHNPLTMSRMDRLFGVTMVERGVSQLVSVDLDRAAAMVEA
ncbi:MAG TPA: chromosome segregation protein SMC, partial [Paracoccaceae bacterium]|nr:chromosome segregation protein SMC [Paracoccaceae bacterium]